MLKNKQKNDPTFSYKVYYIVQTLEAMGTWSQQLTLPWS